jgi:hypothetical protein
VERPDGFDVLQAQQMIARIPFQARRTMVAERFRQWLETT